MKILMVCLGNICRSPLADGIMQKLINDRDLDCTVDSAGTSSYHIGEAPDRRMIATALSHGVDISNLKARQFIADDFENFDLIYAMDFSNKSNMLELYNGSDQNPIKLLLDENSRTKGMEVPDPYFGGDEGFEDVYKLVSNACNSIADKIESGEYS